jgi:hypothetical protein
MTLTVPLVVLLGLVVWLLHRGGGLRAGQSLIIGLFGFYLAESAAHAPINAVVGHLLRGLLHP